MAFRQTGQWRSQLLPEGLSDEFFFQNTEAMLLASRVRDEEVRLLAAQLRDHAATVSIAADQRISDSRTLEAANVQNALVERIGQLIRELDDAI